MGQKLYHKSGAWGAEAPAAKDKEKSLAFWNFYVFFYKSKTTFG